MGPLLLKTDWKWETYSRAFCKQQPREAPILSGKVVSRGVKSLSQGDKGNLKKKKTEVEESTGGSEEKQLNF